MTEHLYGFEYACLHKSCHTVPKLKLKQELLLKLKLN